MVFDNRARGAGNVDYAAVYRNVDRELSDRGVPRSFLLDDAAPSSSLPAEQIIIRPVLHDTFESLAESGYLTSTSHALLIQTGLFLDPDQPEDGSSRSARLVTNLIAYIDGQLVARPYATSSTEAVSAGVLAVLLGMLSFLDRKQLSGRLIPEIERLIGTVDRLLDDRANLERRLTDALHDADIARTRIRELE